jgi:hypothetical protein
MNSLLLATLAVMHKFLGGYTRKDRDNEVGLSNDNETSSSRETVCKRPKCKK